MGDNIRLEARIIAIIIVFDALTSQRSYKIISSDDEAFNIKKKESGEHFDPKVVSAFIEQWPEIIKIKTR